MAEINTKNLIVEIGTNKYRMTGSRLEDICKELGITELRFMELLSRDAYCPTLSAAPTSSTLTYTDTDGSTNHFSVGQLCRWAEDGDYRIAVCKSATLTESSWLVLPSDFITKEQLDTKQDKVLKLENVVASSWVSDSTYTDFPYRCDVACSGVTESNYAEVVFALEQATSGNYAPLCETRTNSVSVWSAENTTITIPTILITI